MGQAKHKKRLAVLGRGPKTRGTGFRYVETIPAEARELTAADIAALEEQCRQQAVLEEGRRLREWNVTALVCISEQMLRVWKEATDYNDQRLVEFAGWTTGAFCSLPVDEDVALAYSKELVHQTRRAGRQLSLDEMDSIVDQGFRNERVVSTAQVVQEATKAVRSAAEKWCDNGGISVERFIQTLMRRSAKAKQHNTDVDSALVYVGKKMSSMFEALCKSQAVKQ